MRGMESDGELVDLYLIADTSLKNKLIVAVELQKEWVDVPCFNSCNIAEFLLVVSSEDSSVEDCPRNGYVVLRFPTLSLRLPLYVHHMLFGSYISNAVDDEEVKRFPPRSYTGSLSKHRRLKNAFLFSA